VTGDAATVVLAVVIGVLVGGATVHVVGRRRSLTPAHRSALERARLVEQLNQIVADLTARLDHREVLHRIARSARDLVGADASAYASLDRGDSTIVAVEGLPLSLIGFTVGPQEGVVSDVVAAGETMVIDDYHVHPHRVPALMHTIEDLHTVVAVPSMFAGEVSGTLFVFFRTRARPMSAAELDVLALLAGHAATALANAAAFRTIMRREAHEQSVVEALADGVAVIGSDGLVKSWNSAAAEMTGISATEALGRPPPVALGPSGTAVEHQLGGDCWIEAVATQLADGGETVLALRDVSEQKALEQAQNLFLATTTHEIKTPLTVVTGFAATLQKRWQELDPVDRERSLAAIVRRSEALVRLIDQLLLGFRLQAGQLEVDLRIVDLRPVLDTTAAGFRTISDRHTIELDTPDQLPMVVADEAAVEDVVAQLLENAIKYSPDGGPITVSARPEQSMVVVAVSDAGIGLSPDDAERVFDRFYRAPLDDRRIGGVGLGLYIVRRLIEAQGGWVRASGQPGAGSRFEFSLPAADADESSPSVTARRPAVGERLAGGA
jgi:signal transduction histidine kinase